MIYVFGKLVTEQEHAFLRTVLTETDRTARHRHFKSIYNTAKRHNTTLQNAHNIFENNRKCAEQMNRRYGFKDVYTTNIYGELVKNIRDLRGRKCVEKCSDTYIKEMTDGIIVNKEKPEKTFFKEVKSAVKFGWRMIKNAFSLY